MYGRHHLQHPHSMPGLGRPSLGGGQCGFVTPRPMLLCNNLDDTFNVMQKLIADKYKALTQLDHKSAIVARAMVEHFNSGVEDCHKLRNCQEEAIAFAAEMGVVIKGTSTTSKIGRHLRDADVFKQFNGRKPGKMGFILEPSDNLEAFTEFLDKNPTYGVLTKNEVEVDQLRQSIVEQLNETGAIMVDSDAHRVPSKIYGQLRDMLNSGQLKVVYVRPDTTVAIRPEGAKKFHAADFWYGDDDE